MDRMSHWALSKKVNECTGEFIFPNGYWLYKKTSKCISFVELFLYPSYLLSFPVVQAVNKMLLNIKGHKKEHVALKLFLFLAVHLNVKMTVKLQRCDFIA